MSTKQYAGNAIIDYTKMTVAKLREALKSHGIPSTGLTRKQHFIDRLIQETAKRGDSSSPVNPGDPVITSQKDVPENFKHNSVVSADKNVDDLVKDPPEAILQAEQDAYATAPHPAAPTIEFMTAAGINQDAYPVSDEERTRHGSTSRSQNEDRKRKHESHTSPVVGEGNAQKKMKHDDQPLADEGYSDITDFPICQEANDHALIGSIHAVDEIVTTLPASVNNTDHNPCTVLPSLHPATAAIYVRNLKRPLQLPAFRRHLATLAGDENTILSLHLDAIRTHAFVLLSSAKFASRVRTGLHDQMWPSERDREPLWVDFVPEDKLATWIKIETIAERREHGSTPCRWKVVYDRSKDGSVVTTLQEVLSGSPAPSRPQTHDQAPVQHASLNHQQDLRSLTQAMPEQVQQNPISFLALDELFRSTKAKPRLYWVPVESFLVDSRLDEIYALTTKSRTYPKSGSGLQDSRRYTFEDGDRLVDNGPEFGLRGLKETRSVRSNEVKARGILSGRSGDHWH